MPHNQRESLIYTVLMCFVMVLWMSIYNVALLYGRLDLSVLAAAWLGFPFAYVFAMCCDWFLVGRLAKGVAFGFLVKPEDSDLKKVLCVSTCMVVPMVISYTLDLSAWQSLAGDHPFYDSTHVFLRRQTQLLHYPFADINQLGGARQTGQWGPIQTAYGTCWYNGPVPK